MSANDGTKHAIASARADSSARTARSTLSTIEA